MSNVSSQVGPRPLRVISLGWGVQSWGLAALAALGELPPVDFAVHADTRHERAETYAFAERWTPWLEARGVKVVTVRAPLKVTSLETGVTPPWFTLDVKGKRGQLRRTCTERWKIRRILAFVRQQLRLRGFPKRPGSVEQQLGITLDEWQRMKDSRVQYSRNVFPYMDDLGQPWRRSDVVSWLDSQGLEIPVKSSCVFCPFHDRETWREIKLAGNGDWEKALAADELARHRRPTCDCFLVAARVPLAEVDLRNAQDFGQLELWPEEECTGSCFL